MKYYCYHDTINDIHLYKKKYSKTFIYFYRFEFNLRAAISRLSRNVFTQHTSLLLKKYDSSPPTNHRGHVARFLRLVVQHNYKWVKQYISKKVFFVWAPLHLLFPTKWALVMRMNVWINETNVHFHHPPTKYTKKICFVSAQSR